MDTCHRHNILLFYLSLTGVCFCESTYLARCAAGPGLLLKSGVGVWWRRGVSDRLFACPIVNVTCIRQYPCTRMFASFCLYQVAIKNVGDRLIFAHMLNTA